MQPKSLADKIHCGEIWEKSQCMMKEVSILAAIGEKLVQLGYTKSKDTSSFWKNKIYQRGNHRVRICLVDDIKSDNLLVDYAYMYDSNTTVITDNQTYFPSRYQILQLPKSFYGIYSYTPECMEWEPDRDFSYSVNRSDRKRLILLLDLVKRKHLHRGYINFNCEIRDTSGKTTITPSNFTKEWNQVGTELQEKYQDEYEFLLPKMPLKNFSCEYDTIYNKNFLNIVVETYYNNDLIISLSEKIFRALVTPAPWVLYGPYHAINYLETIGFDTMNDMIDHHLYDSLLESSTKVDNFIWHSLNILTKLKEETDVELIRQRCLTATYHNQQLLSKLQHQWPEDFKLWLNKLPDELLKCR